MSERFVFGGVIAGAVLLIGWIIWWEAKRPAYMVFPRAEDHYNLHEHCLHLWVPLEGEDPLPDFLAAAGAI